MATDHRDLLKNIRTFPSLIKYLRDELDWPISSGDFEELTYDYTPEELGIDSKIAAKIQEIKRLRPLSVNQPWGIFFVKFEPKRLPVAALRRILSRVVVKKRASANSAERVAWQVDDLLFVSNYGEGEERRINLAHFTHDKQSNLPTLKVLGWDNLDTPLHLDHVADVLNEKLAWPEDEGEVDVWRETWRSAFTLRHREVITTSKALAIKLAGLARGIRNRINAVLAIETEDGPVTKLMKAFQEALIHDLDEDGFADMYAQTIAYGLLSARIANPGGDTTDDIATQLPVTNPFLKELMDTFLDVGRQKGTAGSGMDIDFDELGVSEVIALLDDANMEAVLRDFGDRSPQEDPVIHFYELFLKEYDAKKRMQRGVFYTPRPVVSYIVRSVDELLRTEFDLDDGLADITTWSEMAKRHKSLEIPEGVSPKQAFIQILDPATGTGTFLVEVIDLIHKTMIEKWKAQDNSAQKIQALWNEYVPKNLLPRLYGYELLMAPYAIAHLKIGLKLYETGYRFDSEERARVYLANSLEPASDKQLTLDFLPALAHEALAVNEIKRKHRFTVVIGNPPYAGISANMSDEIMELVEPYKSINGVSLGERKIWAQDDYKKFIRYSQLVISHAGYGILGFITNHGFINEPTSRGMRHNLLGTFSRASVLDLHGSLKKREVCPNGSPDKNVFDIEIGVAISFFRRGVVSLSKVTYSELWGLREVKYDYLQRNTLSSTPAFVALPSEEFYLFVPQSEDAKIEFSQLVSITDVFRSGSNGIQTSRDHVVYGFSQSECHPIIEEFRAPEKSVPTSELRNKFWPGKKVGSYASGDTRGWRVSEARDKLRRDKDWKSKFKRTLYRPFDFRVLFYSDSMIDWPRSEVMSQMLRPNLSLCVGRAGSAADNQEWNIIFVADTLVDMNLFYRGGNVNYPLRFAPLSDSFDFNKQARPNFNSAFLKDASTKLGILQTDDFGVPRGLTPEDIFDYTYAIFHSPGYRTRYAEFLKIDFPRLPLTGSIVLFRSLARLGSELVSLHLMESSDLGDFITEYTGPKNPVVGRVGWSEDAVWLDTAATKKGQPAAPSTIGFHGVPEEIWNFHIGGYQVCHKWLKDRKGRTLSEDDINHYQKIVVALNGTIRIMGEIDDVIEEHGGWPDAFSVSDE